jgi:hypothetical protein
MLSSWALYSFSCSSRIKSEDSKFSSLGTTHDDSIIECKGILGIIVGVVLFSVVLSTTTTVVCMILFVHIIINAQDAGLILTQQQNKKEEERREEKKDNFK